MYPTVNVFLAGGVPEVMLHLRDLGLLDTSVITVEGNLGIRCWMSGKIPSVGKDSEQCYRSKKV